jgi:hypothetical protein
MSSNVHGGGPWHADHTALAPTQEDTYTERSGGEYVVQYGLWVGAVLSGVAVLLFFGLDLSRRDASPLRTIVATIPGLLLVLSSLPGMRACRARRFWPAAGYAGLSLLLTIVIGAVYIVTLAGMCPELSGCRQRGFSLYVVTSAQFLLICSLLTTLAVVLTALGVGLTHRDA